MREAARLGLISYVPGDTDFEMVHKEKLNEGQLNALNFIRSTVLQRFNGTGVQQALDGAVFQLLEYMAIYPGGVTKLEDKEGKRD